MPHMQIWYVHLYLFKGTILAPCNHDVGVFNHSLDVAKIMQHVHNSFQQLRIPMDFEPPYKILGKG